MSTINDRAKRQSIIDACRQMNQRALRDVRNGGIVTPCGDGSRRKWDPERYRVV